MIKSFSDVIKRWPGGIAQFAADVRVSYGSAKQMCNRNSIASPHWTRVAEAARGHGISITEADLSDLARLRRAATKSSAQKKRQGDTLETA